MIIFCVIYLCSVDFVCFYAYIQLATCVGATDSSAQVV